MGPSSRLGRQTGNDISHQVWRGSWGQWAVGAMQEWRGGDPARLDGTERHFSQHHRPEPTEKLQTVSAGLEWHIQPAGGTTIIHHHCYYSQMYRHVHKYLATLVFVLFYFCYSASVPTATLKYLSLYCDHFQICCGAQRQNCKNGHSPNTNGPDCMCIYYTYIVARPYKGTHFNVVFSTWSWKDAVVDNEDGTTTPLTNRAGICRKWLCHVNETFKVTAVFLKTFSAFLGKAPPVVITVTPGLNATQHERTAAPQHQGSSSAWLTLAVPLGLLVLVSVVLLALWVVCRDSAKFRYQLIKQLYL